MAYLNHTLKTTIIYVLSFSLALSGFPLKAFADDQNIAFRTYFSPETSAILEKTPLGADIIVTVNGIDYIGSYAGTECSNPKCGFIFENVQNLGPTQYEGPKSGEIKVRSIDDKPYGDIFSSNSRGNNSPDNYGQSKNNSGSAASNGPSTVTDNIGSQSSPNYGQSVEKGIKAGIATGVVSAFQDYVVFNRASLEELSKLQAQYQTAANNANDALTDLREQTYDLNKSVFNNLKAVKSNLQTFKRSKVNFRQYFQQIESNMQPSAQEIETALNQVYEKKTTRDSYKVQTRNLVAKLNNAPPTTSAIEKDFKKMAVSAIQASAQSELLSEYEISNINLEMAKMSLDVVYGLDPYTGLHRDLYELTTGKNLITGEPLSDFERAISGVGLAGFFVSAGVSSSLSNSLKASFRFIRASIKEGSAIAHTVSVIEKSKAIIKQLERLHAPIRSSIQDIAKFMKKQARKLSPDNLEHAEEATRLLFNEGTAVGKIKKLEQLPVEILKNPSHPLAIRRMQEIALDGMRLPSKEILKGTNDKVVIIGRQMSFIRDYASKLKNEGFAVELFDREWMIKNGMAPTISPQAMAEFTSLQKTQLRIPYEKIKTLKIFKENEAWIKKAIDEGYTIVNIGIPVNAPPFASAMYDMELLKTGLGH